LIRFIGDWKAIGHWAILPDQEVGIMTFIGNGGIRSFVRLNDRTYTSSSALISLWNSASWYSSIRTLLEQEYKRHKHMADAKKYFYLQVLATDPDAQGKVRSSRPIMGPTRCVKKDMFRAMEASW